jgi:hypothetical protein
MVGVTVPEQHARGNRVMVTGSNMRRTSPPTLGLGVRSGSPPGRAAVPALPQNLMTAPIDAVPWAIVAEPSYAEQPYQ